MEKAVESSNSIILSKEVDVIYQMGGSKQNIEAPTKSYPKVSTFYHKFWSV